MGRRDAVQFTLEWAAEARRLGAEITFEPGWETRGNGMSADFEGMEVHHTGFGSSPSNPFPAKNTLVYGRPDLGGPLSNVAGPWCPADRPSLHVLAAHPSNNAGASGMASKNLGPLPRSNVFNKYVFALEIDYGGNVAMAPGQRLAALIFSKAGANVLRRSTEYVRAHAETSVTGKWDPGYASGKTIDMAAFRRDAAAVSGDYPTPVQEDDDMRIIVAPNRPAALIGPAYYRPLSEEEAANPGPFGPVFTGNDRQWDLWRSMALSGETILDIQIPRNEKAGGGTTTLRAQTHWADYNHRTVTPEAIAKVVGTPQIDAEALASQVITALDGKVGLTGEDVEAALRKVLREGTGDPATGPVS